MRLANQPHLPVVEPEGDLPALPQQPTEPTASLTEQPESKQPDPTAIASSPALTDSEFSPERPGPAWMWEFGVMG
ncbi:MAG: hypothetical protein F6K00_28510 [Leptolyngbya sp. SIOISBB]|nr:hypothetical protein [Leptolyngbya sp. SIOISBB]